MIVATDLVGGIGKNNNLPWHHSTDLKIFKSLTIGNIVVMGRNTWDSLPKKPLPTRVNVVLSSTLGLVTPGKQELEDTWFCATPTQLEVTLKSLSSREEPIWIIGGKSMYESYASKCTYIHHSVNCRVVEGCDTFFSPLENADLQEIYTFSEKPKEGQDDFTYTLYYNHSAGKTRNKDLEHAASEIVRAELWKSFQ